jgi:hypothetical protein
MREVKTIDLGKYEFCHASKILDSVMKQLKKNKKVVWEDIDFSPPTFFEKIKIWCNPTFLLIDSFNCPLV